MAVPNCSSNGNQALTLTINLTTPTALSFYYYVGSNSNYNNSGGYGAFSIDGVAQTLSATDSWMPFQASLATGAHTLVWTAKYYSSIHSFGYMFGIDDVSLVSLLKTSRNDFNGDRKSGLFWRNAVTGAGQAWLSGLKSSMLYPGANTDLTVVAVGAGDVDGDRKADMVWYTPCRRAQPPEYRV